MKVLFDTSVLVAALVRGHPRHVQAISAVRRVLGGEDQGYISAHGLCETYAVLTSLPVSPRVSPEAAQKLIEQNIEKVFSVIALTSAEYQVLVRTLSHRQIAGDAVYDGIHIACARKAGVDRIHTFNIDHFRRIEPDLADRICAP